MYDLQFHPNDSLGTDVNSFLSPVKCNKSENDLTDHVPRFKKTLAYTW